MVFRSIARCFVDWQIKKQLIIDKERDNYIYAYEVLCSQLVNIILAALIGISFKTLGTVVVFLISYILLRSYAGGYHATNHERCTAVSAVILIIVSIGTYLIQDINLWIIISCDLLAVCFIWRYSPVGSGNKPLDEKEVRKYRTVARSIVTFEMLCNIILLINGLKIVCYAITACHCVMSVMLMAGRKLKK